MGVLVTHLRHFLKHMSTVRNRGRARSCVMEAPLRGRQRKETWLRWARSITEYEQEVGKQLADIYKLIDDVLSNFYQSKCVVKSRRVLCLHCDKKMGMLEWFEKPRLSDSPPQAAHSPNLSHFNLSLSLTLIPIVILSRLFLGGSNLLLMKTSMKIENHCSYHSFEHYVLV